MPWPSPSKPSAMSPRRLPRMRIKPGKARNALRARAEELKRSINARDAWGPHSDREIEQLIEGSVGSLIGEMVGNITAQAIKVALSGDEAAVAELEARAESIEKNVEKAVEKRAEEIEARADALCRSAQGSRSHRIADRGEASGRLADRSGSRQALTGPRRAQQRKLSPDRSCDPVLRASHSASRFGFAPCLVKIERRCRPRPGCADAVARNLRPCSTCSRQDRVPPLLRRY